MPETHTIQAGDSISQLADLRGLSVDDIWKHGDNAALKRRCGHPNILPRGEKLVIPDRATKDVDVPSTKRHSFRATDVPGVLRVRVMDAERPLEGQTCVADWQDHLGEHRSSLKIAAGGIIRLDVHPRAHTVQLRLAAAEHWEPVTLTIRLGQLEPVDTDTGLRQRLVNLGYLLDPDASAEDLHRALRAFQSRVDLADPEGDPEQGDTREQLRQIHDDLVAWPSDTDYAKHGITPPRALPDQPMAASRTPTIDGYLALPSDPDTVGLTWCRPPEPVSYIIIGCGFAAITNHTTLKGASWGRERLGSLPVLHVGSTDPWQTDVPHQMGQWTNLLTLPGYRHCPPPTDPAVLARYRDTNDYAAAPLDEILEHFLHNETFADCNQRQLDELLQDEANPGCVLPAFTGIIEPRDTAFDRLPEQERRWRAEHESGHLAGTVPPWRAPGANYRVSVYVRGEGMRYVYAQKVDVCTGPGPARRLAPSQVDAALHDEYYPDPITGTVPAQPQRIVPGGHAAISRALSQPVHDPAFANLAEGRADLCVYGGGPTSAWSVERALEAGLHVIWITRDILDHTTFPPARRNHGLLDPPDQVVSHTSPAKLIKDPRLVHIQAELTEVKASPIGCVFTYPSGQVSCKQLVISIGQSNTPSDRGGSAYLMATLEDFEWVPVTSEAAYLTDRLGGARVLGAASFSRRESRKSPAWEATDKYHSSLPLAAQVAFVGITFNSAMIAYCNGFYVESSNEDKNTMSPTEAETQGFADLHDGRSKTLMGWPI
jgi:hypothetical protein